MKKFNLKKKKLYLHEIIVTKEGGIIFLTSMTAKVQKQNTHQSTLTPREELEMQPDKEGGSTGWL